MSEPSTVATTVPTTPAAPLPRPIVRRRRWPTLLIWLLPLAALIIASIYLAGRFQDRGPVIVIRVADANAIDAGSTTVRCHGVEIGKVIGVDLSEDQQAALIRIRLHGNAAAFARSGATFWVVKPEFSGGSISGLGTVISGPYLEGLPGSENGDEQAQFTALGTAPPAHTNGLRILLLSNALNRVGPGTPITFRGVPVGAIESVQLAEDSTHVRIWGVIRQVYGPLVRVDSRFWSVSPADFSGGIFSGIDLKIGSIKQMLAGEVAFVSPDNPLGEPAKPEAEFVLHEQMDEAWKKWRPAIAITPEPTGGMPTTQQATINVKGSQ